MRIEFSASAAADMSAAAVKNRFLNYDPCDETRQ